MTWLTPVVFAGPDVFVTEGRDVLPVTGPDGLSVSALPDDFEDDRLWESRGAAVAPEVVSIATTLALAITAVPAGPVPA